MQAETVRLARGRSVSAWERTPLTAGEPGRLRVIHNGKLDPSPVRPLPDMLASGLGGAMDLSLEPQFAENGLQHQYPPGRPH